MDRDGHRAPSARDLQGRAHEHGAERLEERREEAQAGFDHPELIITGVRPEMAARLLNGIGEMIRAGTHFSLEHCLVDPAGSDRHFSDVNARHFERGVFASSVDYYDCLGPPYPEPTALEVVLPGGKAMLASP